MLRQAQKRTIDDTRRHIGNLVSTIEPTECSNYLIYSIQTSAGRITLPEVRGA